MPKWLVEGQPLQWRIMAMTQDGVFFSGEKCLVRRYEDHKAFDSFDDAADRAKDIVALNLSGVTQIRIISTAFE